MITGGEISALIVEKYLARFLEVAKVADFKEIWGQGLIGS